MRYLIYTRVSPKGSTWRASETTVGDQAAQCRAFVLATDPAGEVVGVITDEFESGKSAQRPGWKRILREVQTGTARWDVLVVRHLDRFSRSIRDAVNALELLHESGKCLIATAQGLNSSNPSGRGVINILLSIAQMEREFASERTKLKMESIAQRGLWPVGRPPYGYKRGKRHDNKLYVDPERAENVRQVFVRYRAGVGATELARAYKMHKNSILYMLRNRTYLGLICYDGKEYRGQHEAMVSPDLFDAAQRLLPGTRHAPRPKAQKYPYILAGLVYCDCGKRMTPASAYGRNGRYNYYQCTDTKDCRQRVRAEKVEAKVLDTLATMRISEEDIEEILEELRRPAPEGERPPDVDALERAAAKAQERKERLADLFGDGLVTPENAGTINARLAKATAEHNDLAGRLAAARALSGTSPVLLEEMERMARSLRTLGEAISLSRGNPADMRVHMSTWVRAVRKDGEKWKVLLNLPGSPNGGLWLPRLALGEPLRLTIAGGVTVYAIT